MTYEIVASLSMVRYVYTCILATDPTQKLIVEGVVWKLQAKFLVFAELAIAKNGNQRLRPFALPVASHNPNWILWIFLGHNL